jgi:hypothetical protein
VAYELNYSIASSHVNYTINKFLVIVLLFNPWRVQKVFSEVILSRSEFYLLHSIFAERPLSSLFGNKIRGLGTVPAIVGILWWFVFCNRKSINYKNLDAIFRAIRTKFLAPQN